MYTYQKYTVPRNTCSCSFRPKENVCTYFIFSSGHVFSCRSLYSLLIFARSFANGVLRLVTSRWGFRGFPGIPSGIPPQNRIKGINWCKSREKLHPNTDVRIIRSTNTEVHIIRSRNKKNDPYHTELCFQIRTHPGRLKETLK